MSDWRLFVKAGCPWCVEAEAFLRDGGYAYEAVECRGEVDAMKELEAVSGQTLTPTLLIGEQGDGLVLADFGVPELEDFLAENGLVRG